MALDMAAQSKPESKTELRKFGLMFGLILVLLFGLLIPLVRHGIGPGMSFAAWPVWPWLTGAVVGAWALLHPRSLTLLHGPWMKFAQVAQWVNTRIIMLLMFYCMILPIGLLLKLFGKDSLNLKFDAKLDSYRIRQTAQEKDHMEKPY